MTIDVYLLIVIHCGARDLTTSGRVKSVINEALHDYPHKIIFNHDLETGKGESINLAKREVVSEYCIIADDDVVYTKDSIICLYASRAKVDAGGVIAATWKSTRIHPSTQEALWQTFIRRVLEVKFKHPSLMKGRSFFRGGCYLIASEHLPDFPKDRLLSEDMYLANLIGSVYFISRGAAIGIDCGSSIKDAYVRYRRLAEGARIIDPSGGKKLLSRSGATLRERFEGVPLPDRILYGIYVLMRASFSLLDFLTPRSIPIRWR